MQSIPVTRHEGTYAKIRIPQSVLFAQETIDLKTGQAVGKPYDQTARSQWYNESGGNTIPSVAGAASIPIMPGTFENWVPSLENYQNAQNESDLYKVNDNPDGWFAPTGLSDLYYVESVRLYIIPNATQSTLTEVNETFLIGMQKNDFKKRLAEMFSQKKGLGLKYDQVEPQKQRAQIKKARNLTHGDPPMGSQENQIQNDRNPTTTVGDNVVYGTVVQFKTGTGTSGEGTQENPYVFYDMPYFYGGVFPYIISYVPNVNDVFKQTKTKLLSGEWTYLPTNVENAGPYTVRFPKMTQAEQNRSRANTSVLSTANTYSNIRDKTAAFGAFMVYVDPRFTNVVTHVERAEIEADGSNNIYYYPPASILNVMLELEIYFVAA